MQLEETINLKRLENKKQEIIIYIILLIKSRESLRMIRICVIWPAYKENALFFFKKKDIFEFCFMIYNRLFHIEAVCHSAVFLVYYTHLTLLRNQLRSLWRLLRSFSSTCSWQLLLIVWFTLILYHTFG